MNCCGSLIGLVVEEDGKKKDVLELIIKVHLLMNTKSNQENMNGLIGEYKHISKRLFHLYGKRKLSINITMMKILSIKD